MFTWIVENMATIIIGIILILAAAAAIASMVRGKRKGKTCCGCGCSSCPADSLCAMNGACHQAKPKTSKK